MGNYLLPASQKKWRRKWQPTPVILPGDFHEQKSLAGYRPWGCKESGMTERLSPIEKAKAKTSKISKKTERVLSCFSHVWLCDPVHCSLPNSSVHGILQMRILEWVSMPSSRGSSPPRDQAPLSYVSFTGRWFLYHKHHLGSPRKKINNLLTTKLQGLFWEPRTYQLESEAFFDLEIRSEESWLGDTM